MEVEEVVKSGSLYVPTQGFLRQKKTWQKKYYVLYNSSRQGIQRLEMFDNEDQYLKQNNCLRIIPLTDCLKVAPSPQKQQSNVFEIRTKDTSYLLSSESFNEMTEWLNCLQSVAFGTKSRSSKGYPLDSNANQFKTNTLNDLSEFQSEENLVYSSVDSPDVYRVRIIDTETSLRCGLRSGFDSDLTLIVTSVNVSLADKTKVVFTWPLRHIRRYGCTKDGFSLEAGRKCASGEGLFSFVTKDGNLIFQAMAAHVNRLKASNNLNDNQIPLNISNISPKVKHKDIDLLSYSHSNQDIRPQTSSSPPLSSSYSSKLNYLATNSSLLPATKIPDSSKRHSIQPPKSPKMIAKKSLTRMPSANTNLVISSSDPKPKASPPIPKPPRKSKESKVSDSEEPVFASREEVIGIRSEKSNCPLNVNAVNDEVLYDEPSELIEHRVDANDEETSKSPFCPSPPPVNHTVSKLTSVLKMMFIEKKPNSIHPNVRDNRVSSRSSGGTSPISSSPPVHQTQVKRNAIRSYADSIDSYGFGYSEVKHPNKTNNASHSGSEEASSHYSKILNDDNDCGEHQYANVIHKDNDVNHCDGSESKTDHYVQNECEYARVVKRSANHCS